MIIHVIVIKEPVPGDKKKNYISIVIIVRNNIIRTSQTDVNCNIIAHNNNILKTFSESKT